MMFILIFSISFVESKPEKKPVAKDPLSSVKTTWPSFFANPAAPKHTCEELLMIPALTSGDTWDYSSLESKKYKRYINFRSDREKYPYDNYEDFYVDSHSDFGFYADNYRDHWDNDGFWVVDSGFVNFKDYGDNGYCYHSFANECQFGVEIRFKQMRIEAEYCDHKKCWAQCPYDYVGFAWTKRDGTVHYPDENQRVCGCLGEEIQVCQAEGELDEPIEFKQYYQPAYKTNTFKTTNEVWATFPDIYSGWDNDIWSLKLKGVKPKMIFKSDYSENGGEIGFFWHCLTSDESYARYKIYFSQPYNGMRKRRQAEDFSILKQIKDTLASQLEQINPYAGTTDVEVTVSDQDLTEVNVKVTFSGMLEDDSAPLDAEKLAQAITESTQTVLSAPLFMFIVDQVKLATIKPIIKLQPAITNTREMAEAVLQSDFKPTMAFDYGCAGKGYFDPFSPIVGRQIDDTDKAFFKWKKCVRCATDNDRKNIRPYDYDESSDVCGK